MTDNTEFEEKKHGLRFRYEKLIDNVIVAKWVQYAKTQLDPTFIPNSFRMSGGAALYFNRMVSTREYYTNPNHLWVAYLMPESCQDNGREYGKWMDNIEMFMSVVTSTDARVVSHMGISRSIAAAKRRMTKEGKGQVNMSILLHGFAATCTAILYPEKLFMLTTPNSTMRGILLAHVHDKTKVHIGEFPFAKSRDLQQQHSLRPVCGSPRITRDMSSPSPDINMRDDQGNLIPLSQATHPWLFDELFNPDANHPSGNAQYVVIGIHELSELFG
jgi:hypothetical protein